MMIDFCKLEQDLADSPLFNYSEFLINAVKRRFEHYTHGELEQWQNLLNALPELHSEQVELTEGVNVGTIQELQNQLNTAQINQFISQLKTLHPWRKGPFHLFGIHVDTEWRSDWKWQRLQPHISSLKGRTVLDVGCGNGYHCWRMLGERAKLVIGIDPSQKFLAQFSIIKKYIGSHPVHLLPIGIEDMPAEMPNTGFDTIFSMGVLYHRKSPINHLLELRNLLNKNGELVLETLVIDGDRNQVLLPSGRYAQMRNVWFLPSVKALELWLSRAGFSEIKTVDVNLTSIEEQRATEWMHFHSLENYLDPGDPGKTIEGYPAPKRAIIVAKNR